MREVLFFGSLAATLVHYDANETQLARELEQQNAFLKLRVSASAAAQAKGKAVVRESFAAVSTSALVELRARARPAVELDGAQWRQRSLFLPLMLEQGSGAAAPPSPPHSVSASSANDRQAGEATESNTNKPSAEEEEGEDERGGDGDVGIVAELAVILSRSGCGSTTVLTKGVALPALNAQTARDECVVVRLHLSAAQLRGHGGSAEAAANSPPREEGGAKGPVVAHEAAESQAQGGSRRSSAARSSGSTEDAAAATTTTTQSQSQSQSQQPALELLVLLRVIDLSEKAAALLEADCQLRAEVADSDHHNNNNPSTDHSVSGSNAVQDTMGGAIATELASSLSLARTARRVTPYGAMPLNDLYRHYRLFVGSGTGGKVLRHSDEVIRLLMDGSTHTERAELMALPRRSGSGASSLLPSPHGASVAPTAAPSGEAMDSAEGTTPQPLFLYRWDAIAEVDLARSLMGEHAFAPLLLTLAHCCNLRAVRVDRNGLGDLTAARLAALFARHRALRQLSLCGNRIHEGGASRLLRLARRNPHLVQLSLADNWCSNGLLRRIEHQCESNAQLLARDCCNLFGPQYDAICLAAHTAASAAHTTHGNEEDDDEEEGSAPRLRLPPEMASALLMLWSTLTAAPIGDVDVWTRNSTTTDLDQYVDDSTEPRRAAAAEAAQAPPSFVPACAYAPLLNEVMRTVARAVRRAVPNTRVCMLFTDMVASTAAQKAQLAMVPPVRDVSAGAEATGAKKAEGEESAKAAASASSPLSSSSSSTVTTVVVGMPACLADALHLSAGAQSALLHAAAEDRYGISFLRLVIVTVRALLDEVAWSHVVPVLRRIGKAQQACGVLPEDYILAARSFVAAVEVCCGKEVCTKEAAAVLLSVLALAVRTATDYEATS